jgi:hypothetical protein
MMSMKFDKTPADTMLDRRKFLDRLYAYCEGCIELRAIACGRLPERGFVELIDHDGIARFIKIHDGMNIYFGIGTRDSSGSGTKENVVHIPALWTDVDFKDISAAEVKKRLDTFPFKATAAVLTGHGVHFYWMLREPSGRDDFVRIEDLLRRIACHFSGDRSACEVARVLRVPGSVNVKYTPVPVKLHFLNDFAYNLDDFDVLPEVKVDRIDNNGKSANPDGWLLKAFEGIPEHGNKHFAGRDACGVKVAGYFVDKLPEKDVLTLLLAWNQRNKPPLPGEGVIKIFSSVTRYKKRAPRNATASKQK